MHSACLLRCRCKHRVQAGASHPGVAHKQMVLADSLSVYRRLAARWGVTALLMPLGDSPEDNVQITFECALRQA